MKQSVYVSKRSQSNECSDSVLYNGWIWWVEVAPVWGTTISPSLSAQPLPKEQISGNMVYLPRRAKLQAI
jgi:hypothetical protein